MDVVSELHTRASLSRSSAVGQDNTSGDRASEDDPVDVVGVLVLEPRRADEEALPELR
jgi:hypothetical protein